MNEFPCRRRRRQGSKRVRLPGKSDGREPTVSKRDAETTMLVSNTARTMFALLFFFAT